MDPTNDNLKQQVVTPPSTTEADLKAHYQMLFQRGLRWLGAGIFMMALRFGINFFVQDSEQSVVISMYVVTSLGSICIMKGLVDILGF
jgi:hypothetical protein